MYRGVLQGSGDFREIQLVFPDHLLALLQLDAADILAGRNLEILVKQCRQLAGTAIPLPRHQRHRQLLPDMTANVYLRLPDDFVFAVDGVGCLEFSRLG